MIESTQDILNIIKSFGIFFVSVALAWFIYYLAMIMRQIFKTIKEMRERFRKLDGFIGKCRAKLDGGASGLLYIMEGVKVIMDSIDKKKKETKKRKKAKSN